MDEEGATKSGRPLFFRTDVKNRFPPANSYGEVTYHIEDCAIIVVDKVTEPP